MTRAIETLTIERPDWIRDDDWRDIVAQLRATYAVAVEAVDRQRCAELTRSAGQPPR